MRWNEWAIVIKVNFMILSNVKIWRDLYEPDAGVRWSQWVISRKILFCRIAIFLEMFLSRGSQTGVHLPILRGIFKGNKYLYLFPNILASKSYIKISVDFHILPNFCVIRNFRGTCLLECQRGRWSEKDCETSVLEVLHQASPYERCGWLEHRRQFYEWILVERPVEHMKPMQVLYTHNLFADASLTGYQYGLQGT